MSSTMDAKLAEAMELLRTSSTNQMMARQNELPRLPIPSLEESVEDMLRAIAPHVSAEKLAETKSKTETFIQSDGPRLHQALIEYDSVPGRKSYLEDFWIDAYLLQRSSIAINTNPFFVLEDDPTPQRTSQIARSTALLWSALKFCQSVRKRNLEPDMFRTTPLCMAQYPKLFGTVRIPCVGKDRVVYHEDSKHVVVMACGMIYWFDVFDADGNTVVTEADMADLLRRIRADADSYPPEACINQAIGVLTAERRDTWALLRGKLEQDSVNAANLKIIDEAILVLCLDNTTPASQAEMAKSALHGTSSVLEGSGISGGVQVGTCINRWFDKSLQIIVCQNGAAGINFEHCVIDGHTVLRFASDVFTETILRFAESIKGGFGYRASSGMQASSTKNASGAGETKASYTRIEWKVSEELKSAIWIGEASLSDHIPQVDLQVLEFAGYGKNFIVSHKLSPDAFVQIAMQVAYYRLYHQTVMTYETLMTKKFSHGRTEAGYVVSDESIRLSRSFDDESMEDSAVCGLLKEAVDRHVKVVRLGSEGRGIRHLFALQCLAQSKGEAEPELFTDEGWTRLFKHVISSSNCGNPALRLFGFGPVAADGFGLGYIIKDDNVQFCVTSNNRQTSRLLNSFKATLIDFAAVLEGRPRKREGRSPSLNKIRQWSSMGWGGL